MTEEGYERIQFTKDGMCVILELPVRAEGAEQIRSEVKGILSHELKERMKNLRGGEV